MNTIQLPSPKHGWTLYAITEPASTVQVFDTSAVRMTGLLLVNPAGKERRFKATELTTAKHYARTEKR